MWHGVLGIVLIAVAAALFCFFVLLRILKKLHPMPFAPFATPLLTSRLRMWVQPPRRIVRRSGIRPGMRVLEVGPGNGAVTVPLARRVAPDGAVVCLEVQEGMLERLRDRLARPENADVQNVETVRANAQEMPLPDASFDAIILVEVLGEVPDRAAALGECLRVLRPGGRLAVTEMIIDPDYALPSTVERLCTGAGFRPVARSGAFWDYTLVFMKPAEPG